MQRVCRMCHFGFEHDAGDDVRCPTCGSGQQSASVRSHRDVGQHVAAGAIVLGIGMLATALAGML